MMTNAHFRVNSLFNEQFKSLYITDEEETCII